MKYQKFQIYWEPPSKFCRLNSVEVTMRTKMRTCGVSRAQCSASKAPAQFSINYIRRALSCCLHQQATVVQRYYVRLPRGRPGFDSRPLQIFSRIFRFFPGNWENFRRSHCRVWYRSEIPSNKKPQQKRSDLGYGILTDPKLNLFTFYNQQKNGFIHGISFPIELQVC